MAEPLRLPLSTVTVPPGATSPPPVPSQLGSEVPVTATSMSAVTVSPLGMCSAVAVSVTVPSATPVTRTLARAVSGETCTLAGTSTIPSALALSVMSTSR